MTAIYKRELKSYLTSMVGYLFIFFILVLTGIYFSAYQLSAAYPKFEYTLSAITWLSVNADINTPIAIFAHPRRKNPRTAVYADANSTVPNLDIISG